MKIVKLPSFIQVESAECGAASLKILLEYFGAFITINTSKNIIGIGRDGSTGREICAAASSFGLTLMPKIVTYQELKKEISPPYIMFWSANHWLVVEGFQGGYMYVSDPAKGRVRYTEKTVMDNFSDLILEPIDFDDSLKLREQTNPNSSLIALFRSYGSSFWLTLVLAVFSLVPEITFSLVLGAFTENVATQSIESGVTNQAWFMFLLSGIFFIFLVTRFYILRLVNKSMLLRVSKHLVSRLLSAPILFYSVRSSGELSDRVVRLTNLVNMLSSELVPGAFSFIRSICCLAFLYMINPLLASYCSSIFLLTSIAIYYVSQVSIRDSAVNQTYLSRCLGILIDIVKSGELVKSTGSETSFFQRWAGNFAQYISASQNVAVSNANVASVIQLSNFLLSIGILFLSAYFIIYGYLTLASYTAFLYLVSIISMSLGELPSAISSFATVNGFKWRLNDTLELEPDIFSSITKLTVGKSLSIPNSFIQNSHELNPKHFDNPSLQLEEISFFFPGCKSPVFSNVTHFFEPNSITSIIGPSGSGKSTLARIIAGLIPPEKGTISLAGIQINKLPLDLAHTLIAYVPQDPFLFGGTLYENLTLNDSSISQESIKEAINATDLLTRLNVITDIDTFHVKDRGTNLSGGQRQLVEIARALVRKPKILILDEATSGFDNNLEKFVLDSLTELNITIISIAHRKTALKYSTNTLDMSEFISLKNGAL
jgi:ABC-type bacteriocin/lantibiotic exporter with double-glycine peptidase domain